MEDEARWRGPARLALKLMGAAALYGLVIQVFLVLGAATLTRWEVQGNHEWIISLASSMRTSVEQLERKSPFVRDLAKDSPARLLADFPLVRDLDRQTCGEYYLALFFGLLAGCGCSLAGIGCFIFFDWRSTVEMLSTFRAEQLSFRSKAGSHCPASAEWFLFALAWGEYREAAEFAEMLRDRYEEWEPQMGRFRANCWYTYQVIQVVPVLYRTTEEIAQRRWAKD